MPDILALILVISAYLLGSICSAIVVCKALSLPDPRTQGSQNQAQGFSSHTPLFNR